MKKNYTHIGILSAMPEEVGVILDNLKNIKSSKFGDLELFTGEWSRKNKDKLIITIAWSGWGKVSAARAATRLLSTKINHFPVEIALFTGVAGAVDGKLNQWDIIVSDSIIQHDMDARPIFDKYVIPALNKKIIHPNKQNIDLVFRSIANALDNGTLQNFGNVYKGLIATGDMFINDKIKIKKLSKDLIGLLAVEMEGASFAQVASQEGIDWIVIRVISDSANEEAVDDFNKFIKDYNLKSFELIKCFLDSL